MIAYTIPVKLVGVGEQFSLHNVEQFGHGVPKKLGKYPKYGPVVCCLPFSPCPVKIVWYYRIK